MTTTKYLRAVDALTAEITGQEVKKINFTALSSWSIGLEKARPITIGQTIQNDTELLSFLKEKEYGNYSFSYQNKYDGAKVTVYKSYEYDTNGEHVDGFTVSVEDKDPMFFFYEKAPMNGQSWIQQGSSVGDLLEESNKLERKARAQFDKSNEWDNSAPEKWNLADEKKVSSVLNIEDAPIEENYFVGGGVILKNQDDLEFALDTAKNTYDGGERNDLIRDFQNHRKEGLYRKEAAEKAVKEYDFFN